MDAAPEAFAGMLAHRPLPTRSGNRYTPSGTSGSCPSPSRVHPGDRHPQISRQSDVFSSTPRARTAPPVTINPGTSLTARKTPRKPTAAAVASRANRASSTACSRRAGHRLAPRARTPGSLAPASLNRFQSARCSSPSSGAADVAPGRARINHGVPRDIAREPSPSSNVATRSSPSCRSQRDDLGFGAPLRLVRRDGHLALEIYNYLGPETVFWDMDRESRFFQGKPRAGFYAEVAPRSAWPDGAAFARAVASGNLRDNAEPPVTAYQDNTERRWTVEYARDGETVGIEIDLIAWSLKRRWNADGDLGWPMLESPVARQTETGRVEVAGAVLACGKAPAWLFAAPEQDLYIAGYHGEPAPLTFRRPGRVLASMGTGVLTWQWQTDRRRAACQHAPRHAHTSSPSGKQRRDRRPPSVIGSRAVRRTNASRNQPRRVAPAPARHSTAAWLELSVTTYSPQAAIFTPQLSTVTAGRFGSRPSHTPPRHSRDVPPHTRHNQPTIPTVQPHTQPHPRTPASGGTSRQSPPVRPSSPTGATDKPPRACPCITLGPTRDVPPHTPHVTHNTNDNTTLNPTHKSQQAGTRPRVGPLRATCIGFKGEYLLLAFSTHAPAPVPRDSAPGGFVCLEQRQPTAATTTPHERLNSQKARHPACSENTQAGRPCHIPLKVRSKTKVKRAKNVAQPSRLCTGCEATGFSSLTGGPTRHERLYPPFHHPYVNCQLPQACHGQARKGLPVPVTPQGPTRPPQSRLRRLPQPGQARAPAVVRKGGCLMRGTPVSLRGVQGSQRAPVP